MAAPNINSTNPLVDKRLINAFIDGVIKTLSNMAQTTVVVQKPSVEKEFTAKGDVAGLIGMVAGSLKGNLTVSFDKLSILTIIENMIGEKHTEINKDVVDCVGEITNMIYGSAKTTLNELGYKFEMAIPTVIQGQFSISQKHSGATLVIPFDLPNKGRFYIEITVQ